MTCAGKSRSRSLALPVSARTRRASSIGNVLAITPRLMWSLRRTPAGRPAGTRAIAVAHPRASASMAQPHLYVNGIALNPPSIPGRYSGGLTSLTIARPGVSASGHLSRGQCLGTAAPLASSRRRRIPCRSSPRSPRAWRTAPSRCSPAPSSSACRCSPCGSASTEVPRQQAGAMGMGEETEREKLRAQLQAASEAFQGTVGRLLREGEMAPQLIILAAAQVVGELGAATARAEGLDVETTLGELADLMRQTGRDFHEMLQAEALPTAGNA